MTPPSTEPTLAQRAIATGSGVLAFGVALAVVGVYALGVSTDAHHVATARATYPASGDETWALVSDFSRRVEWRPGVEQVGEGVEVEGDPRWREIDATEDRFEFVVRTVDPEARRVVLEAAKPKEIGMEARWTWQVDGADAGTVVTITEEGTIANPLFRGVWRLRYGPYAAVEGDLRAIGTVLGGPETVERVP